MTDASLPTVRTEPLGRQNDPFKDWRWQLRHALTTATALERAIDLTSEERSGLQWAQTRGLPLLVTPYTLSLFDERNPSCPIRMQCVPREQERSATAGDLDDPLGEREHEVAPFLIQRYPDRVLLLATTGCAINCRFCTRQRLLRRSRGATPLFKLGPALTWLKAHPEVREVIVSGGDPLVASTDRICKLLEAIRGVSSVEVIRIGTRVPCMLPMRIDDGLVAALRPFQPLWFMVHFNHPRELTEASIGALHKLVDGGFPVMSQTVLLRGLNDDPAILEALFRGLVRARVRPYYLLHADVVSGTGHWRTTVERSIELIGALQGKLSGIALPKLVIDTPGGKGKVPVGPRTIVHLRNGGARLRTFRGEEVDVIDPFLDGLEHGSMPLVGDKRAAGG